MTKDSELADFCQREHPRLVGTLVLYCGQLAVAEELAQEALARTCAQWAGVRDMQAPGAWAHRVAINLANSHFRRMAAERRALRRSVDVPQPRPDPSDAVAVRRAVAKLPHKQRAALVLRYWADLPTAEVASILGTSPANVHQLCHRAVRALRTTLDIEVVSPARREAEDAR